ncbi:MAG: metal-dependent hydrolase [bacterium]|nr:metal-dependent hydrolase [bacterium]
MADFQTHITVGVLTSGVIATVAMAAALVTPSEAVFLTIAGTIGSILPDIDLEGSKQSRTVFASFGMFFAFIALFHYSQFLSIAELCLLWLAIYIFIRYFLWKLFHEFTVHRGIFHSLIGNIFFGVAGAAIFYNFLEKTDTVAWMGGSIIFIGALTHLLFDELYSIDFAGNRVKRSFGTAMKLFDYKKPASAILMTAVLGGILYVAPPVGNFYTLVKSSDNWSYLRTRLLPQGKWFDIRALRLRLADSDEEAPTVTGTIE